MTSHYRITLASLDALDSSWAWRTWHGRSHRSAFDIYGPMGSLHQYWGRIWDNPVEMRMDLLDNGGGGAPASIIDEFVELCESRDGLTFPGEPIPRERLLTSGGEAEMDLPLELRAALDRVGVGLPPMTAGLAASFEHGLDHWISSTEDSSLVLSGSELALGGDDIALSGVSGNRDRDHPPSLHYEMRWGTVECLMQLGCPAGMKGPRWDPVATRSLFNDVRVLLSDWQEIDGELQRHLHLGIRILDPTKEYSWTSWGDRALGRFADRHNTFRSAHALVGEVTGFVRALRPTDRF